MIMYVFFFFFWISSSEILLLFSLSHCCGTCAKETRSMLLNSFLPSFPFCFPLGVKKKKKKAARGTQCIFSFLMFPNRGIAVVIRRSGTFSMKLISSIIPLPVMTQKALCHQNETYQFFMLHNRTVC